MGGKKKVEKVPSTEEEEEEEEKVSAVAERIVPKLEELMGFSLSMERTISPFPPGFFEKITEHHISRSLDIAEKDRERFFEDVKSSRKYNLVYVLILASLFVFLTIFLVFKDKQLYIEMIKLIGTFAAGFLGGIGFNEMRKRS